MWEENRYNDRGQLTLHIDFEGRVTEYRYDNGSPGSFGTGRLLEMRFFDKLVDFETNPELWAEKVVYTYDAFGRTKQETKHWKPDGQTLTQWVTTYSYDAEGRTTEVASPQGAVRHAYDNLGRLAATSTHGNAVFQAAVPATEKVNETVYGYDALGRLATVTVAERNNVVLPAEQTRYEYDLPRPSAGGQWRRGGLRV